MPEEQGRRLFVPCACAIAKLCSQNRFFSVCVACQYTMYVVPSADGRLTDARVCVLACVSYEYAVQLSVQAHVHIIAWHLRYHQGQESQNIDAASFTKAARLLDPTQPVPSVELGDGAWLGETDDGCPFGRRMHCRWIHFVGANQICRASFTRFDMACAVSISEMNARVLDAVTHVSAGAAHGNFLERMSSSSHPNSSRERILHSQESTHANPSPKDFSLSRDGLATAKSLSCSESLFSGTYCDRDIDMEVFGEIVAAMNSQDMVSGADTCVRGTVCHATSHKALCGASFHCHRNTDGTNPQINSSGSALRDEGTSDIDDPCQLMITAALHPGPSSQKFCTTAFSRGDSSTGAISQDTICGANSQSNAAAGAGSSGVHSTR